MLVIFGTLVWTQQLLVHWVSHNLILIL